MTQEKYQKSSSQPVGQKNIVTKIKCKEIFLISPSM